MTTPNPDRFAGARILESSFPDDDGSQFPQVGTALTAYAGDHSRYAEALAVLQSSRLLVPVVALLGEVEYDDRGLAHDKSSDMAAVLMEGADGRMALLAFTGTEQLTAWNREARPVVVPAQAAAQSAIQDQASALVIDIAGPVTFVIEGDDLLGVANGWQLVEVSGRSAWLQPGED
ncbi:SseB family protein [Nocardioides jensenii]|uniref:SseB family protein n=1 Tax=Nocardioides jensenii TaxID=1843 RepID=UPI00082DD3A5|nr:SseB family protein [Nocardioides jensenii]